MEHSILDGGAGGRRHEARRVVIGYPLRQLPLANSLNRVEEDHFFSTNSGCSQDEPGSCTPLFLAKAAASASEINQLRVIMPVHFTARSWSSWIRAWHRPSAGQDGRSAQSPVSYRAFATVGSRR